MKAISLSKREKILLYILGCLLIFVVGWYLLLMPALANKNKLEETYASLQTGYQRDVQTAALYDNIDQNIKDGLASLEFYKEQFYPMTTTDEIDKLLTTLVQKHGLVPISLGLEEAQSQNITKYLEETNDTKEEITESKDTMVKVMPVSQVVSTTAIKSNLSDYIEAIRNMPGVSLTSVTCVQDQKDIKVTFKYLFYMIDK